MVKLTGIALVIGLSLAGCSTTGTTVPTISFSSIVQAVKNTCGVVLDVTSQPTIAKAVASNSTLTSASIIAGYVCDAANAIPVTQGARRFGGSRITIPLVLPNGLVLDVTGTR